jgi:broad specificity polyphosphatase/5'/3'-nucleotidase SurE
MRGADDDMIATAAQWIVGLSRTELVRELGPRQYLNVNLPDPPITEIRGVKVVETSPILDEYTFERVWNEPGEDDEETEELWVLHVRNGRADPGGNNDRRWYEAGYIVIVPMRVDENDESLRSAIGARLDEILDWPT